MIDLGARLLNRNTRGVSLTEAGGLYYERCKVFLKEVDDAGALVGHRSEGLSGTLRVSTSVAFGRRTISPMLIDFMREHRQLKIDITCEDAYVDLISRGVDIALRMGFRRSRKSAREFSNRTQPGHCQAFCWLRSQATTLGSPDQPGS